MANYEHIMDNRASLTNLTHWPYMNEHINVHAELAAVYIHNRTCILSTLFYVLSNNDDVIVIAPPAESVVI